MQGAGNPLGDPGTAAATVALNMLSTALWTILGHFRPRPDHPLQTPVTGADSSSDALDHALKLASQEVASAVADQDPITAGRVLEFLQSPESAAIVRQLFSSELYNNDRSPLPSIRAELEGHLAIILGDSPDRIRDYSTLLFNALVAATERALAAAVECGVLAAHEAHSAYRARRIMDELASVQKMLEFLIRTRSGTIATARDLERRYRKQVGDRHGYIIPPNVDAAERVPIESLYVVPDLLHLRQKNDPQPHRISIHEFLAGLYRAVILGNPGGGKSTLTDKLCHDLAESYEQRPVAGRQLTPVHIILREYGELKKTHNCSILQFISLRSASKYQLSVPEEPFEYLLLSGRLVVILDGLDELLDTHYRQEITGDVESFCNLYPSVPVLVTSREVGYEQAPLDRRRFDTYVLSPFNGDQVQEYATKWFTGYREITPIQGQEMARTFMKESEIVPDLRSNPLMLALMCAIYKGENYIPKNRPEVYERCATMLFDRWDRRRGIRAPLPFESHLDLAMKYLAYWIYEEDPMGTGVTRQKLIEKATEYLHDWLYADRIEAERAAADFVDFCKGRAWVFTDVGTNSDGESLYQFTHRTFLEYFAAAHLVRTRPTAEGVYEVLGSKIAGQEWDVVAQLSFQLLSRQVAGAGDALLLALLNDAPSSDQKLRHRLAFAGRCLGFIVPRPTVRVAVARACAEYAITRAGKALAEVRLARHVPDTAAFPLGSVLNSATDNHDSVSQGLTEYFVNVLLGGSLPEKAAVVEAATNLRSLASLASPQHGVPETIVEFCDRITDEVLGRAAPVVHELAKANAGIAADLYRVRRVSLDEIVTWHGISGPFAEPRRALVPHGWSGSPANVLARLVCWMWSQPDGEVTDAQLDRLRDIRSLGRKLLHTPTPWITEVGELAEGAHDWFFWYGSPRRSQADWEARDSDAMFGLWSISAIGVELLGTRNMRRARALVHSNACVVPIAPLLWARVSGATEANPHRVLEKLGFDSDQQALVVRWMERSINLVSSGTRTRRGARRRQA